MKPNHFPAVIERAAEQLRGVGNAVLSALDTGVHNFGQRFLEGAGMPPSPSEPYRPEPPTTPEG